MSEKDTHEGIQKNLRFRSPKKRGLSTCMITSSYTRLGDLWSTCFR